MSLGTSRPSLLAARSIERFVGVLCGVSLWVIAALLLAGSLERNVLGTMLFARNDELVGYLMVLLVGFGFSLALIDGMHTQIDAFTARLPRRVSRRLDGLYRLAGLLAAILFAVGGFALASNSYHVGRMQYGIIPLALWIPQALLVLGGLVFAASFLVVPSVDAVEQAPGEGMPI